MFSLQYFLITVALGITSRSFIPEVADDTANNLHPFYVSVTQIDQNKADNILEVSCKIFNDDFENTLKLHYKNHYDLLNPTDISATNKIINDYITNHLVLTIDGKKIRLQFVGSEKNEDAIECYFSGKQFSGKENHYCF